MSTITEIVRIEKRKTADGLIYYRTYAICDGDEVVGFGKDYEEGDAVTVTYDDRYDTPKMQKVY